MSDREDQPKVPARGGLNASEAAIAWAFAQFGGDVEACSVLEGDAARALDGVTQAVLETSEKARLALAETWRQEDRRHDSLEQLARRLEPSAIEAHAQHLSMRWQGALFYVAGSSSLRASAREKAARKMRPWDDSSVRTRRAIAWIALGRLRNEAVVRRRELESCTGFDLEQLVDLAPHERERWIRQLGVFQLAELARNQDRRSLVRLRRALQAEDRVWFDRCIRHERDIDRLERGRVRELFSSISRQEPDLTVRLLHLGLYSVAASAGVRFSDKLESVARRLPTTIETLLGYYQRLDRRDAPAALAPALRRSLNDYVHRRIDAPEANR